MKNDDVTPIDRLMKPREEAKGSSLKSIEHWCETKKTDPAAMAATKAVFHWGIGKEVSEKEFDDAVTHTLNLEISNPIL